MYKNQLNNLAKARNLAREIKKTCCHCNRDIGIANWQKHERTCYLNPTNIRPCEVCGTPIKNKENATCSTACANTKFRSGINHPNIKTYRAICFVHHKKECVVCGENKIVEVHHYDGNHKNNDPLNLVPLCPTHHKYWHSRYRHIIKNQIDEYLKMVSQAGFEPAI